VFYPMNEWKRMVAAGALAVIQLHINSCECRWPMRQAVVAMATM